jgi:hypothetical protein
MYCAVALSVVSPGITVTHVHNNIIAAARKTSSQQQQE